MRNTVFIFGAGASHDVIASHTQPHHAFGEDFKPPLTSGLFKSSEKFDTLINAHPELKSLAGEIRSKLQVGANTLEDFMVDLRERAKSNPIRYRQLVQLRFYLRHLLHKCSSNYVVSGNQYGTLIAKIMDIKKDAEVTFVTFNYDTLIEQAMIDLGLMPREFEKMDSYINGPIKLIKPHGSVNWVHRINASKFFQSGSGILTTYFSMHPDSEPEFNEEVRIDDDWVHARNIVDYREPYIHYPAIAVPVNEKNEFVCPKSHIQVLDDALSRARNIVTVGWRGREELFCRKLEALKPNRPILTVVSGGKNGAQSAQEIQDFLRVTYLNNARQHGPFADGFSGFIRDFDTSELEKMLSL